eukprot:SRR837773.8430.p3 GENE.SRR837773.8430~~SRR837773.8430.p3  ORF type:complete len:101 (-),score=2.32 SRR837773.8430:142-444(-)
MATAVPSRLHAARPRRQRLPLVGQCVRRTGHRQCPGSGYGPALRAASRDELKERRGHCLDGCRGPVLKRRRALRIASAARPRRLAQQVCGQASVLQPGAA